jgi:hypothetical protein
VPEIWLNYGITDVVLDIRAENLEQNIDSEGVVLDDSVLQQKLGSFDVSKLNDIVVLHNSKAVQKILSILFMICEQKSAPIPKIFAEKKIVTQLKESLPEGSMISEFVSELSNANLTFIAEMEFDGLFGFETIATRLLKKFGQDQMLSAYAKRKDNLPSPGHVTPSLEEATKFTDNFDIQGIEIVANSKGIVDLAIGHPKGTLSISKSLESFALKDIEPQKTMVISTGKEASNDTLTKALSSVWNCNAAIKNNGLAILLAECKNGIGSQALQQFIEGRLSLERLKNPSKYISGMEALLFLSEIQQKFQIGLVSIIPEFYIKKLNMISLNSAKKVIDYILKTQGPRQKITIVSDGARLLLR